MPEATLRAVADHGQVSADFVRGHYQDVQHVLDQLQAIGVSYDESMHTLEDDAVAKFEASWAQLSEHLAEALRAPAAQKRR